MRSALLLASLLVVSACESQPTVSRTAEPAPIVVSTQPPTATPSPLPSGVVAPQALIDQVTRQRSTVLRVDDVKATLTTMSTFEAGSGIIHPASTPGHEAIWVVAVRGQIRIDALVDLAPAQCALFAYDAATGDVRAMRAGPSAICDPFFK